MRDHAPQRPTAPRHDIAGERWLIVPGLGNSGAEHWQSRWQRCRDDCIRVELGGWDAPVRSDWTGAIDRAVAAAAGRVVLVGHSLGCLAIAWWASGTRLARDGKVVAALLVAPPDVGQQGADLRLLRFAPVPDEPLPFPAAVVASGNDRYATLARSRALAACWGASFHDIGHAGHINAESGLGDWAQGQAILAELVRQGSA